jgi:hypothetical protein
MYNLNLRLQCRVQQLVSFRVAYAIVSEQAPGGRARSALNLNPRWESVSPTGAQPAASRTRRETIQVPGSIGSRVHEDHKFAIQGAGGVALGPFSRSACACVSQATMFGVIMRTRQILFGDPGPSPVRCRLPPSTPLNTVAPPRRRQHVEF